MFHAPTFCTVCGNPSPCVSQKTAGWTRPLLIGGLLVTAFLASLTIAFIWMPAPALLPTTPVAALGTAASPQTEMVTTSPSRITAVPFSPTPDPFAPTSTPMVLWVIAVTPTKEPTPTLTPYEATLRAGQATATARAAPVTCERTTVTPGTPRVCFWEVVLPSPTALPTYPPCETPVPAMRCLKEG